MIIVRIHYVIYLLLVVVLLFGDEANLTKLDEITVQDFGRVGEVIVTKDDTLLMRGKGETSAIQQRVSSLK